MPGSQPGDHSGAFRACLIPSTMMQLNLPNRITLARLASSLALFTVLFILQKQEGEGAPWVAWVALGVFVVTAATDWLDGYLARQRNEVTALGRMMDPFVDKVLVCGTLVFLTSMAPYLVPAWLVVVIVSREFLISGIRGYMESRGVSFAAQTAGKVKMVVQCMAIGVALLLIAIGTPELGEPKWLTLICEGLIWAALITTVYSGWVYARRFYASLAETDS